MEPLAFAQKIKAEPARWGGWLAPGTEDCDPGHSEMARWKLKMTSWHFFLAGAWRKGWLTARDFGVLSIKVVMETLGMKGSPVPEIQGYGEEKRTEGQGLILGSTYIQRAE